MQVLIRLCYATQKNTPRELFHMPEKLPNHLPLNFEDSEEIREAYLKILTAENNASTMASKSKAHGRRLMRIRVLGHLIREAPSIKARECVAGDVNRCLDEKMIEALGEFYRTRFILTCKSLLYFTCSKGDGPTTVKSHTGRTPAVAPHPSHPGFERRKQLKPLFLESHGLQ